jgi:hypothetical protein
MISLTEAERAELLAALRQRLKNLNAVRQSRRPSHQAALDPQIKLVAQLIARIAD